MLPKEINVMKVITYDVEQIVKDMEEHMAACENKSAHNSTHDFTIEDCIEWISDWVQEDFGTDFVIYQDENGNDL